MNFRYWHLHVYKKHDTLRYVTFLYTKILTLRKKQDYLRYVLYTKSLTLCVTQFYVIFEIGGGEGPFFYAKKALCVIFLYAKNNALYVKFLYTKSETL